MHNGASWILANVYVRCTSVGKREFIDWFKNIQMPDDVALLIVGDFKLYRCPTVCIKPGGDHAKMYMFNEDISALGLVEVPLKWHHFTWTNKQLSPLLETLDLFFTSSSCTLTYPNTLATPMTMDTSDHVSCLISFSTSIPRKSYFRFENFWMEHVDFHNIIQRGQSMPTL